MNQQEKNRTELFKQLFLIANNWRHVFYIHTPFCLRKCNYCIYGSKLPSSREELAAFFHTHLPRQIQSYRSVLEQVKFDEIYFGGGTPTIADAQTLENLYGQIPNFQDIPLKGTEFSPYTVTDEHLDLFHRRGFAYASMGVQTLDQRVLQKENRFVVNQDKLDYICRYLEEHHIISNVDLIFFLDTGGPADLEITGKDLDIMMSSIRPVSITLYVNYRVPKSLENRKGVIRLLKAKLEKYPEYRVINSILTDSAVEYDMTNSAEYRLMRNRFDFNFYMLQKVPQIHPFGHNMLAVGEYGNIKPRYNFYYVYDFIDKYQWKDSFKRARELDREFEETRRKLGFPYFDFINPPFFSDETGKEHFKEILTQSGYPYYEFPPGYSEIMRSQP